MLTRPHRPGAWLLALTIVASAACAHSSSRVRQLNASEIERLLKDEVAINARVSPSDIGSAVQFFYANDLYQRCGGRAPRAGTWFIQDNELCAKITSHTSCLRLYEYGGQHYKSQQTFKTETYGELIKVHIVPAEDAPC